MTKDIAPILLVSSPVLLQITRRNGKNCVRKILLRGGDLRSPRFSLSLFRLNWRSLNYRYNRRAAERGDSSLSWGNSRWLLQSRYDAMVISTCIMQVPEMEKSRYSWEKVKRQKRWYIGDEVTRYGQVSYKKGCLTRMIFGRQWCWWLMWEAQGEAPEGVRKLCQRKVTPHNSSCSLPSPSTLWAKN